MIEFPSRRIHIEIQNISREDDIPRSLFYLGGLLFDINKGVKVIPPYSLFSIWICNFNPLSGKGIPELPYYTFEQMYRKKEGIVGTEESFELEDGVTLIFINAQYDWDGLMKERDLTDGERALMEYLNDMNQSHLKKIIHTRRLSTCYHCTKKVALCTTSCMKSTSISTRRRSRNI